MLESPGVLLGFLFLSISALAVGIIVALGALYRMRDAQARNDSLQFELQKGELAREVLNARLQLLQAQIEPHFLFNTLANVQALVESGSPQAALVLRHLISYLRAAVPRLSDADATLGNELQLVRAYLELMCMRMPDRLQFKLRPSAELDGIRFPAMALLTLVENAVRHGIDPAIDGGSIEVGARLEQDSGMLVIWVADTGVGLSETAQPGAGWSNLRSRLQGCYGSDARLDLHEQMPHGLRAELIFPAPAGILP
jgi:LytS/YehU family sensor histidine kinase